MKHSSLSLVAVTSILLLAACAPATTDTPDVTDDTSTPTEQTDDRMMAGAVAAKAALAARLSIDPDDIDISAFEQTDWSDSCLGLGGPAESCLAAITPGYKVTMNYGGTAYHYRTNMDGSVVRAE